MRQKNDCTVTTVIVVSELINLSLYGGIKS